MVGRSKTPTREEHCRMRDLPELGCICCALQHVFRMAQVHHLVEGNKRLGHLYTLALCPEHHTGEEGLGWLSVHKNKKAFEKRFGTQRELLELQNELLTACNAGWIPGKPRIIAAYHERRRLLHSA